MVCASPMRDTDGGYIERQKIRDLNRKVNETYRAQARHESLRETISQAIRELKPMPVPSDADEIPRGRNIKETSASLVVALGDIHYGAKICVKGLRGEILNEYDSCVYDERMLNLSRQIRDILHQNRNIGDVHVLLVGDLIDGILRNKQLVHLEYGIVDSTIGFAENFSHWLLGIAAAGVRVTVHAVSGNHSEIRPLGSKKREFESENMERIILWFLKERLRDFENIFVYDDCPIYDLFSIEGYSFLLLHGDSEKKIPELASETIQLYEKSIDFFVCGHKHREQEYPTGMTSAGNSIVIRVPSICGADSYAQSKGYGGRAGAIAMIIEKDYGRRCVYPINLQ